MLSQHIELSVQQVGIQASQVSDRPPRILGVFTGQVGDGQPSFESPKVTDIFNTGRSIGRDGKSAHAALSPDSRLRS